MPANAETERDPTQDVERPPVEIDEHIRRLVVYVPNIEGRRADWLAVIQRLQATYDLAHTEVQTWPLRRADRLRAWTRGDLRDHARRIALQIDQWVRYAEATGTPYEEIVLVGASVGSLLVRWAWLWADGAWEQSERQAWAGRVKRIVLIAGLNRGVDPKRLGPWRLAAALAAPFGFAWRGAMVGADFVTDLRVTWMRHIAEHPDAPMVVQLLGDRDGLVTREDSRDVEQFPRAAHISVPGAGHSTVLKLEEPGSRHRFFDITTALLGAVSPTDPPPVDPAPPGDIVFVLHGIRAGVAGWVEGVVDGLAQEPPTSSWWAIPATYGYFSALGFALPWQRRKKVRWFLDRYSQALAANPAARFHFIGHSNGTYVIGQSLRKIPGLKFERVYLAASVLPKNHPWAAIRTRSQIECIRHDRGHRDIPVGFLSRGLGMLLGAVRTSDIGGAGHVGFGELYGAPAWGAQGRPVAGGHGAPLATDERRTTVVQWIAGDDEAEPLPPLRDSSKGFNRLSRASGPMLAIALLLLLAMATALLWLPGTAGVALTAIAIVALLVAWLA